jgi:3-phosphoshikimate 1-carboxyvinyltransferase
MNMRFEPCERLSGAILAPADKSISHRAALLGAMSSEPVRIERYLPAADTRSTLEAVRALGALVEDHPDGHGQDHDAGVVVIRGTGLREAREVDEPIDVGNAGTLLRMLPGWLAAQDGRSFTLDGDDSIRRRPVDRIMAPLSEMGAELQAREGRFPPLRVSGARLRSISYELEVASAQVKSCILLAALAADGATTVGEPSRSRDHTERMLLRAGAHIAREGTRVTVENADELLLDHVRVPGDPSSAAFLVAAGVIVPGSRLLIRDVGVNWTRSGFFRIVRRMCGIVLADLEEECEEISPEEPVSDLDVAHGALEGTVVDGDEVPLAIDELPLVALLGCFAEGETIVRGAGELRVKESDRIAGVVDGLRGLGAEIEATEDGFAVRGAGGLRGGTLDALGDHRLAMMGAVAGLGSREGVEVLGMDAAAVSYPSFVADLETVC